MECPICKDITQADVTLRCNHSFCPQCIVSWLRTGKTSCPVCRDDPNPVKGGWKDAFVRLQNRAKTKAGLPRHLKRLYGAYRKLPQRIRDARQNCSRACRDDFKAVKEIQRSINKRRADLDREQKRLDRRRWKAIGKRARLLQRVNTLDRQRLMIRRTLGERFMQTEPVVIVHESVA